MNLDPDWQAIYSHVGRLLETAPDMSTYQALKTPAVMQWAGRARALVDQSKISIAGIEFGQAVGKFPYSTWQIGVQEAFTILYRVLAHAELRSPAALAGTFVPVGNAFDAFAAFSKLLQSASSDVMIVDPYLDESVLTDFGLAVPAGVQLRLLADQATFKASLTPAAQRWAAQYGATRPLQVRLASPRLLHDRALFVDGKGAWIFTQSLKDFAKRSPAEIVRADDTAAMKVAAYEAIWSASKVQ